MKRFSLFIALCAIAAALCAFNSAAIGQTENGIRVDYAYADEERTLPLTDENGLQYLTVIGRISTGKTLKIPESVEMEEGVFNTVRYIAAYAFAQDNDVMNVTIPDCVVEIGENAFADCTNLVSVTLPSGLTSLPRGTFRGCSLLMNITLPETLTFIGDNCFESCSMLGNLRVPASVTEIGHYAFLACESLVLDCADNDYAADYAADNNIFTDFKESPDYPVAKALIYTAILGVVVIAAEIIIRRVRKKRSSAAAIVRGD